MEKEALKNNVPVDEAVRKCMKALKRASSDNERFACLLLVTNLIKVEDLNDESRRRLYEAIGMKFISRLIRTSSTIENCPAFVFKCIGMAVLSYFARDLVPQECLVGLLPDILGIITAVTSSDDDDASWESLLDDSYKILEIISADEAGCMKIVSQDAFGDVIDHAANEKPLCVDDNRLLSIIVRVHTCATGVIVSRFRCQLLALMTSLASRFASVQQDETFVLCRLITSMMQLQINEHLWDTDDKSSNDSYDVNVFTGHLRCGIIGILGSKVAPSNYQDALLLGGTLYSVFDVALTKDDEKDIHVMQLLIARALVEINMTLAEATSLEFNATCGNVLSSCFNIVEKVIVYLCNKESIKMNGNEDEFFAASKMSNVHNLLLEMLKTIMAYMCTISEDPFIAPADALESGVFCGCFRVVCAWISEETAALREDVTTILPFLVQLCEACIKDDVSCSRMMEREAICAQPGCDDVSEAMDTAALSHRRYRIDLLRLFLPGLCHMSAEESLSDVLFENRILDVLDGYFESCCVTLEASSSSSCVLSMTDASESLETLFGVLLNFAVTQPSRCWPSTLYGKIATNFSRIMVVFQTVDNNRISISVNAIVLYLMITRWQVAGHMPKQDLCVDALGQFFGFLDDIFRFDRSPFEQTNRRDDHSELSDLWLIGIDNLISCCRGDHQVCESLKESSFCQKVEMSFRDVVRVDKDHVCVAPIFALKQALAMA